MKSPDLPLDRFAAEYPADGDWPADGELLKLTDDLLRQLAGRCQDNGLGPAASRLEHLENRDTECRGLARTCLGLADDIKAIERLGDEGRLNGSRLQVSGVLESLVCGRAQVHGQEPCRGFRFDSTNQSTLREHCLRIHLTEMSDERGSGRKLDEAGAGGHPVLGRLEPIGPLGRTASERFDPSNRDHRGAMALGVPVFEPVQSRWPILTLAAT